MTGDGVPLLLDWLADQSDDQQNRDWQMDIDGRYWRERMWPGYTCEAESERQRLGIGYYCDLDEQTQFDFVNRVCRRLDERRTAR